jgi:phospholipid transport system substrate-binding protein
MTAEVLEAIHSDPKLAAGDRQKALALAESKVLPHINFTEAARIAVGPAWQKATPEQQQRLALEFRRMLIRVYSSAISAYKGQTMKVLPVELKPGDTRTTVRNQYLRPGQQPVLVIYSMRLVSEGWKIYDVSIQGVSLALAYRSEFDAIVKKEGIDGLIKRMTEKNTPVPLN